MLSRIDKIVDGIENDPSFAKNRRQNLQRLIVLAPRIEPRRAEYGRISIFSLSRTRCCPDLRDFTSNFTRTYRKTVFLRQRQNTDYVSLKKDDKIWELIKKY